MNGFKSCATSNNETDNSSHCVKIYFVSLEFKVTELELFSSSLFRMLWGEGGDQRTSSVCVTIFGSNTRLVSRFNCYGLLGWIENIVGVV